LNLASSLGKRIPLMCCYLHFKKQTGFGVLPAMYFSYKNSVNDLLIAGKLLLGNIKINFHLIGKKTALFHCFKFIS